MNYWTQSKDNIWVAAHRGWCSKYPENTMEAIKAAVEVGVDQIETDVRVTKDGELVLFHDPTVDTTTTGTGKVIDYTLQELRALDAGIHKGEEFKGYRVPTFIEFMDYMKTLPEITIYIELKEYPIDGHDAIAYDVCDRVLKIVDEYGFTDRVVINSFSNKLNEYVREKYGDKYRQHVFYPLHKLKGEPAIDPYSYAYCCCVLGDKLIGTVISEQAACDYLTNRGVEPWGGAGIKDEATVDLAIERGVTLITCNNPDVVLDLLRKKGKRTK